VIVLIRTAKHKYIVTSLVYMIESWTHNRTIFMPSYQSRQSCKCFLLDLSPVEKGKACAAHLLLTAIFITQSTSLKHFTITVKMAMHISIEAQKQ